MLGFKNWKFNENVCPINYTNNLSNFALIFSFKYFNSNRCFDYSFGKFNVITGITTPNILVTVLQELPVDNVQMVI